MVVTWLFANTIEFGLTVVTLTTGPPSIVLGELTLTALPTNLLPFHFEFSWPVPKKLLISAGAKLDE